MNKRMSWIIILFLGFSVIGETQAAESRKVEEKTFSLEKGGVFSLSANEGYVDVKTWDKNEVHLKMIKVARSRNRSEADAMLEMLEIEINDSKSRLIVKEYDLRRGRHSSSHSILDVFDGDFWREQGRRRLYVNYEVTVPVGIRVRLACDEGDVRANGVEGELIIEVDEGDVTIEEALISQLEILVDEGDVNVVRSRDDKEGYCKVEADEGHVILTDCMFSDIDIRSDEGDVELDNVSAGSIWIGVDEGDIYSHFTPSSDGSYHLESDEGHIDISIPAESDLSLRLIADEGRIDSPREFDSHRRDDGERVSGTLGDGGGNLKAFTSEGNIQLKIR